MSCPLSLDSLQLPSSWADVCSQDNPKWCQDTRSSSPSQPIIPHGKVPPSDTPNATLGTHVLSLVHHSHLKVVSSLNPQCVFKKFVWTAHMAQGPISSDLHLLTRYHYPNFGSGDQACLSPRHLSQSRHDLCMWWAWKSACRAAIQLSLCLLGAPAGHLCCGYFCNYLDFTGLEELSRFFLSASGTKFVIWNFERVSSSDILSHSNRLGLLTQLEACQVYYTFESCRKSINICKAELNSVWTNKSSLFSDLLREMIQIQIKCFIKIMLLLQLSPITSTCACFERLNVTEGRRNNLLYASFHVQHLNRGENADRGLTSSMPVTLLNRNYCSHITLTCPLSSGKYIW